MDFINSHRGLAMEQKKVLEKAEIVADTAVRKGRHLLPHLARLCILSTFLEDSLRMWFQWNEQRDYFSHVWRCGYVIGTLFVVVNLFGQLLPVITLMVNKKVAKSSYVLVFIVILQGIMYKVFFNLQFLMKSAAVLGGLVLLLASCRDDGHKDIFAALPSLETTLSNPRNALQLSGRALLVGMFLTLFISENEWSSVLTWVRLFVGLALLLTILVGYKTTLAGLSASVWLMTGNLVHNRFWQYHNHTHLHDYYKYDFFQTMSVIGGLLLLVSIGPGSVSIDEKKKKW